MARHNQPRALAPAEVIQQRKKKRDVGCDRVAEGRYKQKREAYLQEHSSSAAPRSATARLLKAQGKMSKEIAEEIGISRASVFNYLKQGV
jgi:DNA-binding NarL/FixJ family response regulator